MRRHHIAFLLSIVVLVQCIGLAQSSNTSRKASPEDLPSIVTSGLQAYKDKGAEDAIKAWLKGSALEDSKEAISQANNLRQIETFYGKYQTHEVVGSRTIGSGTRMFYLVMHYEKGPLFARFLTYRAKEGWILTSFDFNTKVDLLFPSDIGSLSTQ